MWVLGGLLSAWLTPCKTCYTEYRKSLQCFALIMSVQGVTRGYKDGLQPETLADGTDNECKGSGRSCASATLQSIHFKRTSSTHTTHIHTLRYGSPVRKSMPKQLRQGQGLVVRSKRQTREAARAAGGSHFEVPLSCSTSADLLQCLVS